MKQAIKRVVQNLAPKKFYLWLAGFKYVGIKHRCPLCGWRLRAFLPAGLDLSVFREKKVVGGGYRLNAKCPHCDSLDRERLIYLYLKKKTSVFRDNIALLHIAPEKNLQKILKTRRNLKYISADIESSLADIKTDITEIPLKNNSVDAVICSHVLEHIADDRKAMAEIYRILKPGGWAILQVPLSLSLEETYEDFAIASPEEREKVFGQSDHVRLYARDYAKRLESVGFSVKICNLAEEYGAAFARRYGLLEDEDIYIGEKAKNS